MAAGQDLEPYWEIYRQHFRGHVVQWMEKYRIGNLSPEDAQKAKDFKIGDMFLDDPKVSTICFTTISLTMFTLYTYANHSVRFT